MLNNKNNKYFIFLTFFIFCLLFTATSVSALEVSYPVLPGLPNLNTNPTLPEYVVYFFGIGIALAGALSLMSFAFGAVMLINPNMEAHNDAKDRMKGAVIGLVLTMASFIIMNTINTKLTTPTLSALPSTAGVYYVNGTDKKPCPESNSDTTDIVGQGYTSVEYDCSGGTGTNRLFFTFKHTGLAGGNDLINDVTAHEMKCGDTISISTGTSFKMEMETPGIYYCLNGCNGNICSGYMSPAMITSNKLGVPFIQKIAGITIVNDSTNDISFGAILHKGTDFDQGSQCSFPIGTHPVPTNNNSCYTTDSQGNNIADIKASSVDIFELNDAGDAGDGVTLYSEANGWDSGDEAGFLNIPNDNIPFGGIFRYPTEGALDFTWTAVGQSEQYEGDCLTFQDEDCQGSIRINGGYLVALYSTEGADKVYCQTFTDDVPDLAGTSFLPSGTKTIDSVYIVPIE